jgi:hypothetical protein
MLVKHRPKRGKGRPPKEDQENHSIGMNNEPARKPGNSRLYIEERLQRDQSQLVAAEDRGGGGLYTGLCG